MSTRDGAPRDAADAMTERLDAILVELRRQGRAAIAAQAAAEACLEVLQATETRSGAPERTASPEDWLRELIPVFDALDRAIQQAEHGVARTPSLLPRWLARPAEGTAFVTGLRLVRRQLDEALGRLGAHVDAPTGGAADPERHRVVEVRGVGRGPAGEIVELVRRGYAIGARVVREAEVVVRG